MIREELLKKAAIAQANKVWWIRFFWGLFILILIIIACILVVRWEINTPVNNPSQQGILCTGGAEHTMNFTDTIGAFGCRRSMNQAFEAATDACKNLQNSCTGTCTNGETCQSVPSIVSTDQSWGVVSCITDITYQCPCKCI